MNSVHKPTIGYYAPYVGGQFFRQVRTGAYREIERLGARLLVVQMPIAEVTRLRIAHQVVDGWISVLNASGVVGLQELGRPVVVVAEQCSSAICIVSDNIGGAYGVTAHLIRQGHRAIGFVGDIAASDLRERLEGYRLALTEAGIAIDERWLLMDHARVREGGAAAAAQVIADGLPLTAIVAATDLIAFGVIERFKQAGYRVPEDIAIVGFDDVPESQATMPPLTTVHQSIEELGATAVRCLIEQIQGTRTRPEVVRVPTHLVVRASCGAPAMEASAADQVQPAAASVAESSWRMALAQRIATLIQHPIPLAADQRPELLWPQIHVVLDALTAAIHDRAGPGETEMQQAWAGLLAVKSYGRVVSAILDALTAAAEHPLDGVDLAARARMRTAVERLRNALLTYTIGMRSSRITAFEDIFNENNNILEALTVAPDHDVQRLTWLRGSQRAWACLGLWEEQPGGPVRVVGTYPQPQLSPSTVSAADFPPLEMLVDEMRVVELLGIRTARNDWGMLAITQAYREEMDYLDLTRRWATLLGARLDTGMLLGQLEDERGVLQASYERERALALTVRELGCPIIPLGQGVLLIPLIGVIDESRARLIIETTLASVSAQQAHQVLLDLTGVPLIDTNVAAVLLQLARMIQLLGARAGIIGVRPEIAQSIVSLGVDLHTLQAYASLSTALSG